MTVQAAFSGAQAVVLDTSPAIYFLSDLSPYNAVTVGTFAHCTASGIRLVASPVTLAESLAGETELPRQLTCYEYLTSPDIQMIGIDSQVGEVAGNLRRSTRLKLPDCLQLAVALSAGCDAFLTNDAQLAKAPVALRFVLVSDLDA